MEAIVQSYSSAKRNKCLVTFTQDEINKFVSHTHCPVCATTSQENLILKIGKEDWRQQVNLVQCGYCSHIYYSNSPAKEIMLEYYATEWMHKKNKKKNRSIQFVNKTSMKVANLLRDLAFNDMNVSLLDVGCGQGVLMAGLAKAGFTNVYGCEQSKERVLISSLRFPGRIYDKGYQSLQFKEKFDVIYSNHVVEHLHNPHHFFSWAVSNLKERGLIIIIVPDARYENSIDQALFLPHLHSFTVKSLAYLSKGFNFSVLSWKSPNFKELAYVFYRDDFFVRNIVAEKFNAVDDFLDDPSIVRRIRAPWLEKTEPNQAITLVEVMTSMTQCKKSLEKSYFRLRGWKSVFFRVICFISIFLEKVNLRWFSIKMRILLKFISEPGCQINSAGYIRIINNSPNHTSPCIHKDGNAVFIMK